MNLYSKKQRWKIVLVFIAALIVGTSLWITGNIVNKIKEAEKRKVEQWASYIRSNIEQVNIQDSLLLQQRVANNLLVESEKSDVKEWVDAMHELSHDYEDYSFFIQKIKSNNKIPLIMLNHEGEISEFRNLPFDRFKLIDTIANPNWDDKALKERFKDTLKVVAMRWAETNPPIELDYILNQKFRVYYSQSNDLKAFQDKSNTYREKSKALFDGFNERLEKSIKLFPMAYIDAETGDILSSNLDENVINDPTLLKEKLGEMEEEHALIPVEISGKVKGYIYYQNSELVDQLSYYPYIQFGIIGLFLLVAYFLFSTFRKAEQNQVWVGMAKETAHQLGTPISSLMAWVELLKSQGVDQGSITEINKDLARLETVTDRFSKIGTGGELELADVKPIVEKVYDYLGKRVSKKLEITITGEDCKAMLNQPLLEWVIENLSKNGIDAMEGDGKLNAHISQEGKEVYIDISDTGKGIPSSKLNAVFEPGYTTKKRGWGLGLSLVKRIVEEYHKGRVSVFKSELDKGTTFRVALKAAK